VWTECEEHTFRVVKAAFIEAPVLRYYDLAADLRIETDASVYAISAILSQKLYAGEERAG
jgi:hypothetical protein